MTKIKYINVKLTDDVEREAEMMEWLEDKPMKYILLEALELYKEHYETMKTRAKAGEQSAVPTANTSVEEPAAPASKFLKGLGKG